MQCLYVYVNSFKSLIRAKRIQFAAHCSLISFADPAHILKLLFLLELIFPFNFFKLMEFVDCNNEFFLYVYS